MPSKRTPPGDRAKRVWSGFLMVVGVLITGSIQAQDAAPRITVTVRDTGGEPIPGVWVKAVRPRGVEPRPVPSRGHEGYTNFDGQVVLGTPLGVVQVIGRHPVTKRTLRSDRIEIVEGSDESVTFTISANDLGSIRGRITLDGEAPTGLYFSPETRWGEGRFGFPNLSRVPTDRSGRFQGRLRPGNYRVFARRLQGDPYGLVGLALVSPRGEESPTFTRELETIRVRFEYPAETTPEGMGLSLKKIEVRDSLGNSPLNLIESGKEVSLIPGRYRIELGWLPMFHLSNILPVDSNLADVEIREAGTVVLKVLERIPKRLWDDFPPIVIENTVRIVQLLNDKTVDPPRFIQANGIGRAVRMVPAEPTSPTDESHTVNAMELPVGVSGEVFCEHKGSFWRGIWSGQREDAVQWSMISARRGQFRIQDVPAGTLRLEFERIGGNEYERHYHNRMEWPIHDAPGGFWDVQVPSGEYRVRFLGEADRLLETRQFQTEEVGLDQRYGRQLFVAEASSEEEWARQFQKPLALASEQACLRNDEFIRRPRGAQGTLVVSAGDRFFFKRIDPYSTEPTVWGAPPTASLQLEDIPLNRRGFAIRPELGGAVAIALAESFGPSPRDSSTQRFHGLPGIYSVLLEGDTVGFVELRPYQSTRFRFSKS